MKAIVNIFKFIVKVLAHVSSMCMFIRDWVSSLIFNFVYLPTSQAVKMPIWVHKPHFAKWFKYKGKIVIDSDYVYPRMIRLGVLYNSWYPDNGITFQIDGTIIFKGKCIIGNDTSFFLGDGATITIGNNFSGIAHGKFISQNAITIGDDTRIGWNVMLLDTNFHYMTNVNDGRTNSNISAPIIIGNHNWLGNGVTVSKGFCTADYVTIGAGSRCRGKIQTPYTTWCTESKLIQLSEGWYRDLSKDADIFDTIK